MRATLLRTLLLTLITGAALAASPIAPVEPPANPPAHPPANPPAKPKASLANVTLKDLDGKDVKFADLLGKPMIVEMWATWCGPCREQRKVVHSVAEELSKHVHLIAVSVDDSPAKVKAWLTKNPTMAGPHISDVMVGPDFRAELRKVDTGNTIPKVLYVSSKGEILEVTGGGQDAKWLLARAKSLK
jgi:thiol-disulfide isomerase/thioredoxin